MEFFNSIVAGSCLFPRVSLMWPPETFTKSRIVAGSGFEPESSGYEPDEIPLLYPAMFYTLNTISYIVYFATLFIFL